MILTALTKEDAEQARQWRNKSLQTLRTPFLLTQEMQEEFYLRHICARDSRERFWAAKDGGKLAAMVGFVRIEWENHLAEISNICSPAYFNKRMETVELQLYEGFMNLGFSNIYFECYHCDPAITFWQEVVKKYDAYTATLKHRKLWQGKYWDTLYFNINHAQFGQLHGLG